jgi:hypothetical protein
MDPAAGTQEEAVHRMEVPMTSDVARVEASSDRSVHHGISRYLLAIGAVVMLAGLLFGCDQGVICGALDGIKKSFHPSTVVIEIVTLHQAISSWA